MVIHVSEAIALYKAETSYYPLFTLVYTLVTKNIRLNQAKHKLSQVSPFTKILRRFSLIQFWKLLMIKEQFTYS